MTDIGKRVTTFTKQAGVIERIYWSFQHRTAVTIVKLDEVFGGERIALRTSQYKHVKEE